MNLLRVRMGLTRLGYRYVAERYPARRSRLLAYWLGVHRRTLHQWHHYHDAPWLHGSWYQAALCIHHFEGAWSADTGNGYYGGFQADTAFMQAYNPSAYRYWGTADKWPVSEQLRMAYRGWQARGWAPWPATSAMCGL